MLSKTISKDGKTFNREFDAKVSLNGKGKKVCNFGRHWGAIKKGNMKCLATGEGLVVIDIDTKNLKELPKKLRKALPKKPTVITERGYHYYLTMDSTLIPQTQKLLDNLDIRSDGGLVFTSYTGSDKGISYKKNAKPTKPSKDLVNVLQSLSEKQSKKNIKIIDLKYKKGKKWKQFDDGHQHDMLMATAIKMFKDRHTDDEVWSRMQEYQARFLDTTPHEDRLMMGRFKWAKSQIGDDKIKGKVLKPKKPKKDKKSKKPKKDKELPAWKQVALGNGEFDEAKCKSVDELEYLGFVAKGHHTVMYGASGTMKTTIAILEMVKQLEDKPKLEIFFYSFDASNLHHKAIFEHVAKRKLTDRFHILSESPPDDIFEMIDEAESESADMGDVVFIIDTYKKIVGDVNNKAKNAEVMDSLKTLTKLGATVVTIAHANKDGINQSGTAEIEQDSDALLRFDVHVEQSGIYISITKGGRIRYDFKPCTYFISSDVDQGYDHLLKHLKKLKVFVSIDTLVNNAKEFIEDGDAIRIISDVIGDGGMTPEDIRILVKSTHDMGKVKVDKVLERYNGSEWRHVTESNQYQLIKKVKK